MKTTSIIGKHLSLRPFLEKDLAVIFKWRSRVSDLFLWYQRPEIFSFDEFCIDFTNFRRNVIHVLMIMTSCADDNAIGMVYSYKVDYINRFAFLCTYVDEKHRRGVYGGESTLLFLQYLFEYYPFRKIYSEIYEYNLISIQNCIKGGFVEEGRYKKHKWYKDSYRDMIIYALYRDEFLSRYRDLLPRLKKAAPD